MRSIDIVLAIPFLVIIYVLAFLLRKRLTNPQTINYFIPALTFKILGAISVGLIYQFYYGYGGDTMVFYERGIYHVANAFFEEPSAAIRLIFYPNEYHYTIAKYIPLIHSYYDTATYFVVRIGSVFAIFTGNTYTNTAICFALFSFSGMWSLYLLISRSLPQIARQVAIAFFFFPSVFFWGSGLLKDPLAMGCLCWGAYVIMKVFIYRQRPLLILWGIVFFYLLAKIKIYIVLCFIPAVGLWLITQYSYKIKDKILRALVLPIAIVGGVVLGAFASVKLGETSNRYSVDKVLVTAEETARWLTYMGEHDQGSVYSLGDFDYSYTGILKKIIPAIWVTLFRPYVFEARNVVMLLSSLESLVFLVFTIFIIGRHGPMRVVRAIRTQPFIVFCLLFAVMFAFAVGISTYNFGSLVRYKIPMMPFYLLGLICIDYNISIERKMRPFLSK